VAVENPGYPGLRQTFELEGASVFAVPVDESGLQVDELTEAVDEQFRLVYLSPSHQNPIGVALSLSRRVELLNWARSTGAIIVEDEHDSEFQFGVAPIPALKGLDEQNQVIFLGSFYKTLFPSLGIAYLVLPEHLVDVYCRARDFVGEHVPLLLQAMLADFMQRGYLLRHVRKMQVLYAKRRLALLRSLEKHFGSRATVFGEEAGMHALVQFETSLSETEIITRAKAVGVGLVGTSSYYVGGPVHNAEFAMGYADLTELKIEEGVKRLAAIIS
jgi:GntR family transcriptional regulator/MocR family aminotransferase